MNTKRPIRADHVARYLAQDKRVLPYWLKEKHGLSETESEEFWTGLPAGLRGLLENNVRVFIDKYMMTSALAQPPTGASMDRRTMPEDPPPSPVKPLRPDIPRGTGGKGSDAFWDGLFTSAAREEDYTPYVWGIRKQWESDVREATASGQCSSCARSRLTRKYVGILREHIIEGHGQEG